MQIRNYSTKTISSYMHFLKLFLNSLSAQNIKNVSGKVIINYLDDCKTNGSAKNHCCLAGVTMIF